MGAIGAELPDVMGAFGKLHETSMKPDALEAKHKELLAVAISIAIRCEGCIACHVKDAVAAGATREEMMETIGVAIMMGGGPSVAYCAEAQVALEEYLAEKEPHVLPPVGQEHSRIL